MLDILYNLIIYPLVQIIECVYLIVWKIFKNSGYAVIGVSVAVTFLCLPLYIVAEKWQETERSIQKKMKPQLDRIKAVFKGDERYMITTTYYKQCHYHPIMALRSSFGLLIQIPFFIAAYTYLSHLEELQGFHFYFIKDMGAPDALLHIGTVTINILPVIMTLINIIAGIIYTQGLPLKDKVQLFAMAAVFLILLYNSPAGLVLYWTMNNIFSLIKNIFYKLKNPLRILYICLCIGVLMMDYYLLFIHHGFLYRRLMLITVISLILITPLLIKFIRLLLNTILKPLYNNTPLCTMLFFSSISLLWILIGYVLPSFVVASSPLEFSYIDNINSPFYFLFHTLNISAGFLLFWTSCIYFLFGKKIKTLLTVFLSIIAFGALINAFIFTGDYGVLSPILTFSDAGILKAQPATNIINTLVLLIPIIIVFILIALQKIRFLCLTQDLLCVALLCLSVVNSVQIANVYREYTTRDENTTATVKNIEPIFHLSKDKYNVFIIMLDRAISSFIPYILDEKPELAEIYEGFIYYPNTLSFADHTLIGVPPLYGGYEYTPAEINKRNTESLLSKHNEALLSIPYLFSKNDFSVTVTDPSWANYSWIPDLRIYDPYPEITALATIRTYTDLWLQQHPEASSTGVRSSLIKRNFLWYSFLKTMPTLFRDSIYNDGFWWNTNKSFEDLQDVVNNYAALDFLPEFTDFTAEKNTYTFMVNELTHEPSYLQAPDYIPQTKITDKGSGPFADEPHYHANISALLRIGEWIQTLKENDAYNNTRIIIVSDHGAGINSGLFTDKFDLPFRPEAVNPLLLVKDFNAQGTLKTDMTFMTNADVPSLSCQDIISQPENPFTHNPISSDAKDAGVLIANSHLWSPDGQYKNTFKIADDEWFFVHDNIFDPTNWRPADAE